VIQLGGDAAAPAVVFFKQAFSLPAGGLGPIEQFQKFF